MATSCARHWGDLRNSLCRYAATFEPALLSGADAGSAVEVAGAIERMAAPIKGLAGACSAETGAWKEAGDRSPAHHLARSSGSSVGQAAEILETARRLPQLPATSVGARGRRPSLIPRPGAGRSTTGASCAATPTAKVPGTCACETTQRWAPRS